MKSTVMIGAMVALLAGVSLAQEKASPILPPGIAWMPDYVMALARAKEEGKPIMVMFTMVDEPANQAIAKNHLKDRDIIRFSRRFVCLLAYTGFLPSVQGIRFDGTEGKVSDRYGSVTSGECNLVDMRARLELTSSPVVSAPQFIFLGSDGETVLLRHVWMLPKGALLKKCSNDRVRSNLLRCLQGCVGDGPELQKAVLKMLKSSGQLDRVTALYVASGLEIDKKLEKAILKAAKTRNTRVRCAAYYAAATLRIKKGLKAFEKAVKSERGKAEQFCLWAISELAGTAYDGELDPDSAVEASLPDAKMREGELSDI